MEQIEGVRAFCAAALIPTSALAGAADFLLTALSPKKCGMRHTIILSFIDIAAFVNSL
jgi:hypothetical protein